MSTLLDMILGWFGLMRLTVHESRLDAILHSYEESVLRRGELFLELDSLRREMRKLADSKN